MLTRQASFEPIRAPRQFIVIDQTERPALNQGSGSGFRVARIMYISTRDERPRAEA
jgi:hypothetical protein